MSEKFWIVECRDSDGNDVDVLDFIVQAEDSDKALIAVMTECMRRAPEDTEEDGGFGAYYPCDCEIPEEDEYTWDCSHGGFLLDDARGPFDTLEDAENDSPVYHGTEIVK